MDANLDQAKVEKEIGEGNFANVFLLSRNNGKDITALKVIKTPSAQLDRGQRHRLQREMQFWAKMKHPHICKFIRAFMSDDGRQCMESEYVSGGTLSQCLKRQPDGVFSEKNTRAVLYQLFSAIAHCHSHQVCHRDIKPDNILYDGDRSIKVTDFGLCVPQTPGVTLSKCVGSPCWMAPEAFDGGHDGFAADMWACGVVMFQLLTGKLPFRRTPTMKVYDVILQHKYTVPSHISATATKLLHSLLSLDPKERPKAADLATHPWFQMQLESDRCNIMSPQPPGLRHIPGSPGDSLTSMPDTAMCRASIAESVESNPLSRHTPKQSHTNTPGSPARGRSTTPTTTTPTDDAAEASLIVPLKLSGQRTINDVFELLKSSAPAGVTIEAKTIKADDGRTVINGTILGKSIATFIIRGPTVESEAGAFELVKNRGADSVVRSLGEFIQGEL